MNSSPNLVDARPHQGTPKPCAPRRLSASILRYFEHGLSLHIGAGNLAGEPQLCRAIAFRLEPDHRISVLLPAPAANGLVQAILERPFVAMVCCQPSTHQALQIKGRDAVIRPACVDDWRTRADFKQRFIDEIEPYGFGEDFASAWLDVPPEHWRALTFTPTGAWNQTPGPGAGQPVALFEEAS